MKHRHKSVRKLRSCVQKRDNVVRNMLTSLVMSWQVVTTSWRARVLKHEAEKFFSTLVKVFEKYDEEKDVKREVIRRVQSIIFSEAEWKKVVNELLPKYKEEWKTSGFVTDYKMWTRSWDNSEKVMVKLI